MKLSVLLWFCLVGAVLDLVIGQSNSDCLTFINDFRSQQGVAPLSYNAAEETCVNGQAQQDQTDGFHASFGKCSEQGQCECWRQTNDVKGCVQAYIDEGPGGGHYEILKDAKYKSVSCGYYPYGSNGMAFYTQSFYTDDGGAQPAPVAAQQDNATPAAQAQATPSSGIGPQPATVEQPSAQPAPQQQEQPAPEPPKQDASKPTIQDNMLNPEDCEDGGSGHHTLQINWNGRVIDVELPQEVYDKIAGHVH